MFVRRNLVIPLGICLRLLQTPSEIKIHLLMLNCCIVVLMINAGCLAKVLAHAHISRAFYQKTHIGSTMAYGQQPAALSLSVPQFVNSSDPQILSPSILNSLVPQFLNSSNPQFITFPIPQFLNSSIPQFHNSLIPQFLNSPIPQFLSSSIPQFLNK